VNDRRAIFRRKLSFVVWIRLEESRLVISQEQILTSEPNDFLAFNHDENGCPTRAGGVGKALTMEL
jgi:hypothetical protein